MASQPITDPTVQPVTTLAAYFLLHDGDLTVRLENGHGALAPIATDAATLEAFGRTCLAMAATARQLADEPHLSAGRDLPVFTRARLAAVA